MVRPQEVSDIPERCPRQSGERVRGNLKESTARRLDDLDAIFSEEPPLRAPVMVINRENLGEIELLHESRGYSETRLIVASS
jgi:hypothetical protein